MRTRISKHKSIVWADPSIVALMAEAQPGEGPEDVIRRKARALVDEALELGWAGPPFDPCVLASLRGIEVVAVDEPIGSEARIYPTPTGCVRIEYDESFARTRIHFSICHELVHTFFPNCYEMVRNRSGSSVKQPKQNELESLCDLGAAELLMPVTHFVRDLSHKPVSLDAIVSLAEMYGASVEATMIRAAQFSEERFATAVFSERFKPAEEREAQTRPLGFIGLDIKPKLRVHYVSAAAGFGLYIPKSKSAPSTSVAYKALLAAGVHEAQETWDIPGFGTRRVQATVLPRIKGTNRVAVFFSTKLN